MIGAKDWFKYGAVGLGWGSIIELVYIIRVHTPYSACISSIVAGSFHNHNCQGTICSGYCYVMGSKNIGTNLSGLKYWLEMLSCHPCSHT